MWTEKLASGKVRFVERYKDPLTDKWKKVKVTMDKETASTRKQAAKILQERIDKKTQKPESGLTLSEIATEFYKTYEQNVKPSTAKRMKNHLRILNEEFGQVVFEKITPSMVNSYYLDLLTSNRYQYNSVNQANNALKQVIKFALKYKGVDQHTLLELLEVPKINRNQKNKLKYLEPDELTTIIDHLKEIGYEEYARMVIVQSGTGMRYSEMISLTVDDLDLEENSLLVSKNYDHDHQIFTKPKTGTERTVYFNDTVKQALIEQIQYAKLKMIKYGFDRSNRLLFLGKTGKPIRPSQLNVNLKGIIDKPVSTHYFRHTFISMAVQNGLSKDIIAEQVGHADTQMIDKVYSHFTDEMRRQQKSAMLNLNIAL